MEKPHNKKYENALIYSMILIFFGMVILGLWTLTRIPLLPIGTLLLTTPMSFLLLKNRHLFTPKLRMFPFMFGIFLVSVVCLIIINLGNQKTYVYFEKLFIPGKVISKRVFIEGDGEEVDHYERRYYFKPKFKSSEKMIKIIDGILFIVSLGLPCVNYRFIGKAFDIDKKIIRTEQ